jgi:hypothetical protein
VTLTICYLVLAILAGGLAWLAAAVDGSIPRNAEGAFAVIAGAMWPLTLGWCLCRAARVGARSGAALWCWYRLPHGS